jgi:pyridoxal phosphate enzyme (YggS family)
MHARTPDPPLCRFHDPRFVRPGANFRDSHPLLHLREPEKYIGAIMFRERIDSVERRILAACARSGRRREDILLIAVTKTLAPDVINAGIASGLADIGENRVQEYLGKRTALLPHRFHLIGHLQRNKVKAILPYCTAVHSVDSARLAEEIERRASEIGMDANVLLEVNASGEASKHGVPPDDVPDLHEVCAGFPHLTVNGLMTVAEETDDPSRVRRQFRTVRALRDSLQSRDPLVTHLSMGMSGDFEIAIEEGATMIRLGTVLFGPRISTMAEGMP